MNKTFLVYIMTNPRKTVLYTGVTNNLPRRIHEHKEKLVPGFASRYNVVIAWVSFHSTHREDRRRVPLRCTQH